MNGCAVYIKPSVTELNEIQREWMNLAHDAPQKEKERVFKLMARYPATYISGHDGRFNVVANGMPFYASDFLITKEKAIAHCVRLGGRSDIAWNGKTGEWYAL